MVSDLGQAIYEWPQSGAVKHTLRRQRHFDSHRPVVRHQKYVLIDRQALSREGLSRLLADTFDGAQIEQAASLTGADKTILADASAVLMVIRPGKAAIKDCMSELSTFGCPASDQPIVLLSEHWDMQSVRQALAAGVRGCIALTESFRVVAAALRLVFDGGTYVPPEIIGEADAPALAAQPCPATVAQERAFTPQEQKVLGALLEGKSNKRIARDLSLCESTVKVHVRHIMRKLSVTNRTQVALRLMREGRGRPAQNGGAILPPV